MKAVILYFEMREELRFQHPLVQKLKEKYPGLITFDLDQNSSADIFSYAEHVQKEAREFVLVADTSSSGKLMPLVEQVITRRDHAGILFTRENPLSQMLQKIMPPDRLLTTSDQVEQIEFIRSVLTLQQ